MNTYKSNLFLVVWFIALAFSIEGQYKRFMPLDNDSIEFQRNVDNAKVRTEYYLQ